MMGPAHSQVSSPQPVAVDRGHMRCYDWPSLCHVPKPQPITTAREVGSRKKMAAPF